MKILIIFIAVLVLGVWFGQASLNDPGLITIARDPYLIELPLALFVLGVLAAFAVLYLLLSYLFSIFRAPRKVKQWNKERQNQNAQTDTLRGYARLIEGDWSAGEKVLSKRLDHCKTPLLNYLGIAYAAQQRQDFAKRDKFLDMAEKTDPANRMAVDLTRARMLSQAGDYAHAKPLLASMHEQAPANKTILRLMSDVYKNTEDWDALTGILPKLEKHKALSHEQVCELDVLAREASMSNALSSDGRTTEQEFKALPRKRKSDANMAAMYAKQLIQEGDLKAAEVIVRKAISKNWSSELAGLYGLTRARNVRGQINLATAWLGEHEQDAALHLTLARLNMLNDQVDKAKEYYAQAIKLGAGDEAYYELGTYYEEQGDQNLALEHYKSGLQTATALAPAALDAPASRAARLESVVTPGMGEGNLVVTEEARQGQAKQDWARQSSSDQQDVDDQVAEVIEDKAVEKL